MVTDLTAARSLERQATARRCVRMADEARQLRVPRMREGVGGRGWRRRARRARHSRIHGWRSGPRLRQQTGHRFEERTGCR